MQAPRGRGDIDTTNFFTLALDGGSGQRQHQAALYPRQRTPVTHCLGGWVGLRAGLDR
jgi:hypothetical protein